MSDLKNLKKKLEEQKGKEQTREQQQKEDREHRYQQRVRDAYQKLEETLRKRLGNDVVNELQLTYELIVSTKINNLFESVKVTFGGSATQPAERNEIKKYDEGYIMPNDPPKLPVATFKIGKNIYHLADGGWCGMLLWSKDETLKIQKTETKEVIDAILNLL